MIEFESEIPHSCIHFLIQAEHHFKLQNITNRISTLCFFSFSLCVRFRNSCTTPFRLSFQSDLYKIGPYIQNNAKDKLISALNRPTALSLSLHLFFSLSLILFSLNCMRTNEHTKQHFLCGKVFGHSCTSIPFFRGLCKIP